MAIRLLLSSLVGIGAAAVCYAVVRWVMRSRTAVTASLTAFLLGTVMVGSSFADSSVSTSTKFEGYPACALAHIYINNTTASPHMDARGIADTYHGADSPPWCDDSYDTGTHTMGPNDIETREDLYVYSYSQAKFVPCNYGAFLTNPTSATSRYTHWDPNRPCGGNTWYFDSGYGAIYNGQWYGGWTQTPNAVKVN